MGREQETDREAAFDGRESSGYDAAHRLQGSRTGWGDSGDATAVGERQWGPRKAGCRRARRGAPRPCWQTGWKGRGRAFTSSIGAVLPFTEVAKAEGENFIPVRGHREACCNSVKFGMPIRGRSLGFGGDHSGLAHGERREGRGPGESRTGPADR